VRRLLLLAGALCAAALSIAAVGGASAQTTTPLVPSFSGPLSRHDLQRRPWAITISGDGSNFLAGRGTSGRRTGHMTWTQWSTSDGRGTGANWVDDCKPDCADGTFRGYAIQIHVYRPRRIAGRMLFTRLTMTFTAGRPSYIHSRQSTLKLVYQPKYDKTYFWNVAS
jgi:hypothetical protein